MTDIDQLSRFYDFKINDNHKIFSFGGLSDLFFTWKDSDELIEKGAIKYSLLSLFPGTSDSFVLDFYREKGIHFPFYNNRYMFDCIYAWNIKNKENEYCEYVNKINKDFGGYGYVHKNNCFVFFAHNLLLHKTENPSESILNTILLLDDLNLRNAKLYQIWFENNTAFNNKFIELIYLPINSAKANDKNGYTENDKRKYVYSDILYSSDSIIIRYTVIEEQLYLDLENAKDRTVESEYFLELLQPFEQLYYIEFQQLKEIITKTIHLPRGVGVAKIPINYKWTDNCKDYHVSNLAYHLTRKEIAKICNSIGIKKGEYSGKETNRIIRAIQSALIETFETKIMNYDRIMLHKEMLSIYSKTLHNINIHKKRYKSFENIDSSELAKFQDETISLREEEKLNLRVVEFAVETNLALVVERGRDKLTRSEVENIFAFSNWLIVLFDAADICFMSDVDRQINVRDDFVIEVIETASMKQILSGKNKRIYDNNDYSLKFDDEDKHYLEKAVNSFKTDTGIDFNILLLFLEFLSLLYDDSFAKEIHPNVFEMQKSDLIDVFSTFNSDETDRTEISNLIDYLTINPSLLKEWKGKPANFLPINERENRPNRFNLRPISIFNDRMIFSPIVMSDLHDKWKYGMTDFYLPLEFGLKNTVENLLQWKKRYEDLIVDDVIAIFKSFGFKNVWKEVSFHKIDKKHNHPLELGDYDVLAFDENSQTLWIIECKVLNKVGSIHENIMQQQNFFINKKYDEKFQRRIDYMNSNWRTLLEIKHVSCDETIFIKPVMVTNKVFFSRYKHIEFEIITPHELKNSLKEILTESN